MRRRFVQVPTASFVPVSARGSIALIASDDRSSVGVSLIDIARHPLSGKIVRPGRRKVPMSARSRNRDFHPLDLRVMWD